jgi:uncharacterized protein
MNKTKEIVWESLAWPSMVVHHTEITGQGINGHGFIVGKTDQAIPVAVEYNVSLTPAWQIQKFSIKSLLDHRIIELVHTGEKWYESSGKEHEEFAGMQLLDISLTPFTNTLPIKQLAFEGNKLQKIEVIYFDENVFSLRRVQQLYGKVTDTTYRFQDIELPDFAQNIDVDEDGLVIEFPQLFKRI